MLPRNVFFWYTQVMTVDIKIRVVEDDAAKLANRAKAAGVSQACIVRRALGFREPPVRGGVRPGQGRKPKTIEAIEAATPLKPLKPLKPPSSAEAAQHGRAALS